MENIPATSGLKKTKSGIFGLDKMLNGGLIENRPYLVLGGPGAGKSILGMHFLMYAVSRGESALYITLEEPYDEIRENMVAFGWDTNKIRILDVSPEGEGIDTDAYNLNLMMDELKRELEGHTHKRVVLDSTTTIRLLEDNKLKGRRRILSVMKLLTEAQCTSLLLCEETKEMITMESFLARGVIHLHTKITSSGEKVRAISIDKMRGTSFDERLHPYEITNQGIQVAYEETPIEIFE
ncbi:MAG: ATPase [Thermoplasmata archaeon]|nr:ATPase [Thermoplasmata archaeon]